MLSPTYGFNGRFSAVTQSCWPVHTNVSRPVPGHRANSITDTSEYSIFAPDNRCDLSKIFLLRKTSFAGNTLGPPVQPSKPGDGPPTEGGAHRFYQVRNPSPSHLIERKTIPGTGVDTCSTGSPAVSSRDHAVRSLNAPSNGIPYWQVWPDLLLRRACFLTRHELHVCDSAKANSVLRRRML
jgi:hypothetical protein